MRTYIRNFREQFHPLFYARKHPVGRKIIHVLDRPVWMRIPEVSFKIRGRFITHGLAFGLTGSQERKPEALAVACVRQLNLRSFWDVGANIGYYSWLLRSVEPNLEIVLFEALPANTYLIDKTLKRHKFPKVKLIPAGASDQRGSGVLHADVEAGATSSLEKAEQTFEERHWGVRSRAIPISLVTIDEERLLTGPIDMMKIDVEGHESNVLSGAYKTIEMDQPILLIECGHRGHHCLDQLESLGYCIIDADRIDTECDDRTLNYLCFPKRFSSHIASVIELAQHASGVVASATGVLSTP